MPFAWKEFLELARDLSMRTVSGYSKEAAERTSVSRAYYAAFCHARNYATANLKFEPRRTGEDHRLLREHFRRLGEAQAEVGEALDDLRKWRNQCDYDDVVDNLPLLVQGALESARKILDQCR